MRDVVMGDGDEVKVVKNRCVWGEGCGKDMDM